MGVGVSSLFAILFGGEASNFKSTIGKTVFQIVGNFVVELTEDGV
jgi:hypothetical protein